MGEISKDLLKFQSTVTRGELGKMRNSASTLQDKVSSFLNSSNSAMNGIDSCYNSANKGTLISAFSSITDTCNSLNSAVSGDLNGILSSCDSLLGVIEKLDALNKEIAEQTAILNRSTSSESEKYRARSAISQKNTEFDETESKAEATLNSLKGAGGTLSVGSNTIASSIADTLIGGSLHMEEIVVNGTKVKCLVYVPTYLSNVEKLPVMMYMNGATFKDSGEGRMTQHGLGKLIEDGTAKPSGIVVIPYVQNGRMYEDKSFRDTLAQLPFEVAKKYNGDEERVSLAGTSYGAVTAYRLVSENPGKYSAIIAACGAEDVNNSFKGMKVINYTGRGNQGNHTNFKYIEQQTQAINDVGGDATYIRYDDQWAHNNVGDIAFAEYVLDENGNKIPVYELAFRCKRNTYLKDATYTA